MTTARKQGRAAKRTRAAPVPGDAPASGRALADAPAANADGDYLLESMQAETGLRRAIALLKSISTGDGDDERSITVAVASFEADIARVLAERQAFLAELTAIAAPTQDQVDEIVGLAKQLDAMVANAQATKSIIATATAIFKTWSDRPLKS